MFQGGQGKLRHILNAKCVYILRGKFNVRPCFSINVLDNARISLLSLLAFLADRPLDSLRSLFTFWTLFTGISLRTGRTLYALRPLRANRPCNALDSLRTLNTSATR